jgi:hypothetical protein
MGRCALLEPFQIVPREVVAKAGTSLTQRNQARTMARVSNDTTQLSNVPGAHAPRKAAGTPVTSASATGAAAAGGTGRTGSPAPLFQLPVPKAGTLYTSAVMAAFKAGFQRVVTELVVDCNIACRYCRSCQ